MIKLALTLPGQTQPIPTPVGLTSQIKDLSSFTSGFLNIAFYIAIFLTFYWLVWGTFQYILASGNKEGLAKARERIKWALIGLVVIFAAFSIAKLAGEIFESGKVLKGGLPF